MPFDDVRRYARQTAVELVKAGIPQESLMDRNGVRVLLGWPVWGQVLHIEIWKGEFDPVGYGQSERAEIWLRHDGTLIDVRLLVDIWPGRIPDRLESLEEASDLCLQWADVAVNQSVEQPKVPPGRYGLFENAVTLGLGAVVEDPGSVVLKGLKKLAETSFAGASTQFCVEARNRARPSQQAAAARNAQATKWT